MQDLPRRVAVPRRAVRDDDRSPRDLARALGRHVRDHLAPVVRDELLRDVRDGDAERSVAVFASLDREVDQRLKQGELVGRGERAVGEKVLELQKNLYLAVLGHHISVPPSPQVSVRMKCRGGH